MNVFLSYRRADSQVTAGRMAQFLDGTPAIDEVFLDVDNIGVGENFEQAIQATLDKVSHVFVLIGPQWQGPAGTPGRARIFDADDMVRQETRIALLSKATVVPILIDEARMPRAGELPDELRGLPKINAFALRTAHFDEDMDNLLDVLLGQRRGRGSRWRLAPLTPTGIALRALGGLLLGGVVLLSLGLANRYLGDDCYDLTCTLKKYFDIVSDADALGLVSVLALGVLVIGAVVPFLPRWLRRRH
jgi:TIR domain